MRRCFFFAGTFISFSQSVWSPLGAQLSRPGQSEDEFQRAIHSILFISCFNFQPVMRLKMLPALPPSKSHDEDLRIWSKSCGLKEMASELFKTSLWLAGFGAKAPALIGESLARCFRAQCWCYHIVSSLNGLPTVCLKGSHNDRDQLITGSLHKAARPSHGWTTAPVLL